MKIAAQCILCTDQINFESIMIIHATHRVLEAMFCNKCYFY